MQQKKHSIYYGLDSKETTAKLKKKVNTMRMFLLIFIPLWGIFFLKFCGEEKIVQANTMLFLSLVIIISICIINKKNTKELLDILYLDCDPRKLHEQIDNLDKVYVITKKSREFIRLSDKILSSENPKGKMDAMVYENICDSLRRERLYMEGKTKEVLKLWKESFKGTENTTLTNIAIAKTIADYECELGRKEEAKELYKFVADNGGTTSYASFARKKLEE